MSIDFYAVGSVAGWFLFHSLVGIANKCIFQLEGARFPIFLTSLHMLTSFALGHISLHMTAKKGKEPLSLLKMLTEYGLSPRIWSLSIVFSLSVALGNISLQYIGLPLAQMIGALTPVITMLFDVLLQLITPDSSRPKYTSIAFMAMFLLMSGAVLSTLGEVNFTVFGFLCAFTATALRSLRSLLQEYLLAGKNISRTFHLLYLMSLPSFIMLFSFGIYFEKHIIHNLDTLFQPKVFALVVLSSLVAFGYNAFGFVVSLKVSAVAAHILGNIKMVFCIAASLIVFGESASLHSWTGILLTFIGGGLFWYGKKKSPSKHV